MDEWTTRAAEEALPRQEHLLQALYDVARCLASASPARFEATVRDCLGILGETVGADRVYLWKSGGADDAAPICGVSAWHRAEAASQDSETKRIPDPALLAIFGSALMRGVVNGSAESFPARARSVLQLHGIAAVLLIPLWHGETLWGGLGFLGLQNGRSFATTAEQALVAAGILLSSFVMRGEIAADLAAAREEMAAQEKLLFAVNEVASLLIRDSEERYSDFILKSLQFLAESVDADRSFIWRNSMQDGVLCGTELCEWARGARSFTEADERPVDIPLDSFLSEWRTTLLQGKNLNMLVKDMGPEFLASPASSGVLTTMNIPLQVHGAFWGLIGFDDMHRERLYTKTEMDILKSGGMLIAAAIMRDEMLENLMDAKEDALLSTRAKSEFLARMSHEIRTPLNAVIGMTTLAQKSDDLERIKYCLDKIDGSSRQLLSIINDVLDMSKIESGKFEIYSHPFDFEKMLQHSLNVVQVRMEEKHQELVLDLDLLAGRMMIGDELRLSQVLINLLTNAVKFTPDFGTVTLRVRETQRGDGKPVLHVEVADTGIGISAEQQRHLFASFEQADGGITRQYGGTGLGLAICKKIIELMHGDIWVESELGRGATFIFEAEIAWGDPLERFAGSLRRDLRVLVVDDSRDVLDYFGGILDGFGIACDVADSGALALELAERAKCEQRPYALAFVDWTMPGMSGAETTGQLVRLSDGEMVVVAISVSDHSDIEEAVRASGAQRFLPKPVLPSALYDTIVQATCSTQQSLPRGRSGERDWSGRRILLAEDIDINREILIALLEETGVAIDCAVDGKIAVEMFRHTGCGYDLILMDMQMPVMDGLQATREIRGMAEPPCARTIPIVAMTANAFKEDVQACLDAGMNDHVAKPIELEVLLTMLDKYLTA